MNLNEFLRLLRNLGFKCDILKLPTTSAQGDKEYGTSRNQK